MRTVEKTLYKFDELDERAQELAIERLYDINTDTDWYDYTFEDAAEIGRILGIDLNQKPVKLMNGSTRYDPAIWFEGFSHQGQGSNFEAVYRYAKGAKKAIREHAPQDNELHRIADELQAIQAKNFYAIEARISANRRYYSMDVDVERTDGKEIAESDEDAIRELMEDFNHWIFKQLREEYEYQTSEEAIRETILANDYEFDEDGNLAS